MLPAGRTLRARRFAPVHLAPLDCKAGNRYMRTLLVGAAQYILGPFGPDCDLRRRGLELAGRGGRGAKKKAVVATARKLAVVMHRLWSGGGNYIALREQPEAEAA